MPRHLLWLRRDLRTHDNPALHAACLSADAQVAAVYFLTPAQWQQHDKAACQLDLELRTLHELQAALAALHIPLLIRPCDDFAAQPAALLALCAELHCTAVYANRELEVNELARDRAVASALAAQGLHLHLFDDACIVPPGAVLTGAGQPYSVFTPFRKAWWYWLERQGNRVLPVPAPRPPWPLSADTIPTHIPGFTPHVPEARLQQLWPAGEEEALRRLHEFSEWQLRHYTEQRDFPALSAGTSRLSPYLAIGAISARQCLQAALNHPAREGAGVQQWISELAWRDFYKHILVAYPRVCRHQPFRLETRALQWRQDSADFERWCQGRTGFPLVDAAMRQLHAEGWMHNRLRMVCAMFLTKDLYIDWRWGERYFMQHLIDGDLSANNGGWQWSASTGNDAAPYFRIFNPQRQSERFDPEGRFLRHYLPELAHLDNKQIHAPHGKQRQLWLDYPLPMVEHSKATAEVIAAFKALSPVGQEA